MDATHDAEPEDLSTLSEAVRPAIEAIAGQGATLSAVRPAGKPYRYQLHLEQADGTLRRLQLEMGAATLRQVLEVLAELGKLRR